MILHTSDPSSLLPPISYNQHDTFCATVGSMMVTFPYDFFYQHINVVNVWLCPGGLLLDAVSFSSWRYAYKSIQVCLWSDKFFRIQSSTSARINSSFQNTYNGLRHTFAIDIRHHQSPSSIAINNRSRQSFSAIVLDNNCIEIQHHTNQYV